MFGRGSKTTSYIQSQTITEQCCGSAPTYPVPGETLGMNALQRRKQSASGYGQPSEADTDVASVVLRDLDKISSTTLHTHVNRNR